MADVHVFQPKRHVAPGNAAANEFAGGDLAKAPIDQATICDVQPCRDVVGGGSALEIAQPLVVTHGDDRGAVHPAFERDNSLKRAGQLGVSALFGLDQATGLHGRLSYIIPRWKAAEQGASL